MGEGEDEDDGVVETATGLLTLETDDPNEEPAAAATEAEVNNVDKVLETFGAE